MKHFDSFSGYGGFTIPIKQYKVETIGFSEVDKYASAVLKYRFPGVINYGDITKIKFNDLPDFEILTGGTPCQDLSRIGRRKGLFGIKSRLFFEFVKLLQSKQPKYFVWENVEGALSSSGGWDFARVINEFSKCEYSLQWGILDAKEYLPHIRKRVFVVGYFGKKCETEIFSNKIRTKQNDRLDNNTYNKEAELYPTPTTSYGYESGYIVQERSIRRATPIEYERLMGLPDNWTKYGVINSRTVELSDNQRYKLCGNGVVVPVVNEVLNKIFGGLK